jgi:hypothetical protein
MGLDPVEFLLITVALVPEALPKPVAELHAGVMTDQPVSVLPKNLVRPCFLRPHAGSPRSSSIDTDISFYLMDGKKS